MALFAAAFASGTAMAQSASGSSDRSGKLPRAVPRPNPDHLETEGLATDLMQDVTKALNDVYHQYLRFKKELENAYQLQCSMLVSTFPQWGVPKGGTDVVQLVYSSNLTWNPFTNTAIGSGSFNFSFLQDQFWTKANTASQQARLGLITTPNNWSVNGYQYNQIMYTHTLPGSWNWLSVTVGQYTFLAYDDNEYADNAQTTSSACRCRKAPHRPIQTGLLVHMLRPRSRMVSSPSREGSRELPTSPEKF